MHSEIPWGVHHIIYALHFSFVILRNYKVRDIQNGIRKRRARMQKLTLVIVKEGDGRIDSLGIAE